MADWTWFERHFDFNYPPTKFPDLLVRWRGTPARLEELVRDLPADALTWSDGAGWTIQQNVGHLIDVGYLATTRLDDILRGEARLLAADLTNARTNAADHNRRPIRDLLAAFRRDRAAGVAKFEAVSPARWGDAGLHPRLNKPMRIVDILCFDCEHDDYHLARIWQIIGRFRAARSQTS